MDLGTDLSALPDLSFSLKSGRANLVEALARRLMTPRGGLFYDLNYGFDLRAYLQEDINPQTVFELESLVAVELQKDQRVLAAEVTVSQPEHNALRLDALIQLADGPFRLILRATDGSVEVLYAGA